MQRARSSHHRIIASSSHQCILASSRRGCHRTWTSAGYFEMLTSCSLERFYSISHWAGRHWLPHSHISHPASAEKASISATFNASQRARGTVFRGQQTAQCPEAAGHEYRTPGSLYRYPVACGCHQLSELITRLAHFLKYPSLPRPLQYDGEVILGSRQNPTILLPACASSKYPNTPQSFRSSRSYLIHLEALEVSITVAVILAAKFAARPPQKREIYFENRPTPWHSRASRNLSRLERSTVARNSA